ncbi:MAG: rhodanese-like domain-containing protein [Flavobacteriales bacterium]
MKTEIEMKMISPKELREWMSAEKKFQLIDVREEHEVAEVTIGGVHIPMDQVIVRMNEIENTMPVVIHCKSGRRSSAVVQTLERKFGLSNLYSLEGGIAAYIEAQ